MVRVSIIGPPGTGKTRRFVEEIKDKLTEAVATSVTLSPIIEIAKRSGFEPKTLGLRTVYGLAESNLLKEGYIDHNIAKYLDPAINIALKRKVAKELGLSFSGKEVPEIVEIGTFETLVVYYTKAIFLKGDFDAVYEFLNEAEKYGLRPRHFDYVYKLYKEGKYYDYAFLILDAWKHQVNIAKYIHRGTPIYFKYVYIDEAQDLGVIPYKLFELYEDQYEEFKLFGDPAQTIYGFLGAKPGIILKHGEHVVLNPTHRFGKNIAKLGNHLLSVLRFPYRIEHTNKEDSVFVSTYTPDTLLDILRRIPRGLSVAILTRTNSQANKIRKLISYGFAPVPIKESDRNLVARVFSIVKEFIAFKETGSSEYLNKIRKYLPVEELGIKLYLQSEEIRKMSVTEFIGHVEKKLFGKRIKWVEDIIEKLLLGYRKVYVDTIHSAKGLEFDVVIIYDEIPKLIREDIKNPETYRDELFVYYTGITRAKKKLIILRRTFNYFDLFFRDYL